MTPMVDLGFLLITFFVITTQLAEPSAMQLNMPKDGPPPDLGKSNALTILINDNKIYYYNGDWADAVQSSSIRQTSLAGSASLRDIIESKQRDLDNNQKLKEGRDGMMMLVKAGKGASYKMLVDVLDEALISRVKKYAIVKITGDETEWLRTHDN
jgi:biopolymer transport protein ExbD